MLDRCFLVNRYTVAGGRQLVVVNTHNSAYDDGTLRKKQMVYLRGFLVEEYEKGNYIIVPTNRRLAIPYDPALSPTTVIDYYLLSPNIMPVDVQGVNLGFISSDHQPVLAKVRLKI